MLCVILRTCVAAVVVVVHSETVVWLSGNSVVWRRSWVRVWARGVRLSPRSLLCLPWLSHNCHCASSCTGSHPARLLYPESHSTRPPAPAANTALIAQNGNILCVSQCHNSLFCVTCRKLQVISCPWQDLDLSSVRLTVAEPFWSTCLAWLSVSVDHDALFTSALCSPRPTEGTGPVWALRSPLLLEDVREWAAMVL